MEFLEKKHSFSTGIANNKENGMLELPEMIHSKNLPKKKMNIEVEPSVVKNYAKTWS